MVNAEQQHHAWLARSFGRTDYLPLSEADLNALASAGEYVDKYPGTHLFREGDEAHTAYQEDHRHLQFIERMESNWANVRVFDSWVRAAD